MKNKDTDIYTILQRLLQQTQRIEEKSKETKEQAEKTARQVAPVSYTHLNLLVFSTITFKQWESRTQ